MVDTQHFCLRWNNYQSSITSAFENLRDDEDFVDVTLACDGRSLKAHRVVLSACSPYFRELLKVCCIWTFFIIFFFAEKRTCHHLKKQKEIKTDNSIWTIFRFKMCKEKKTNHHLIRWKKRNFTKKTRKHKIVGARWKELITISAWCCALLCYATWNATCFRFKSYFCRKKAPATTYNCHLIIRFCIRTNMKTGE